MKIEDFVAEHNGNDIPWRLFTPNGDDKEYCVLWVQGWSSSMDSHRDGVERMAKDSNTPFATLDYAGHGLSKVALDDSTRQQQHEELVVIFDELKRYGFKKIIVVGGSFGGYMTALLTGVRPVYTAVLRCSANYPNEESDISYKDTKRARAKAGDYAAYMASKESNEDMLNSKASAAIAEYDGFTYVLEHEFDEVVPAKVPQHYYALSKYGNYLIIPNTPHSPKTTDDPASRFAYIEHTVVSIIEAVKLQDRIH